MSENRVIWLCARCAKKRNVVTDTDPVELRECDACHIRNWTRPAGQTSNGEEMVKKDAVQQEQEEAKTNTTMSEVEQLRARIKELEKT